MLLRLRPESNELMMVEFLSSQWRCARCTYYGECKYYVMCVTLTDKTWHLNHSGASFQGVALHIQTAPNLKAQRDGMSLEATARLPLTSSTPRNAYEYPS